MDDARPRIVGSRALPCHGGRAARLVVTDAPVVRACAVCGKRFAIAFLPEPHLSARLGITAYRLEMTPFVDARTRRRQERAEAEPTLPFGDWGGGS